MKTIVWSTGNQNVVATSLAPIGDYPLLVLALKQLHRGGSDQVLLVVSNSELNRIQKTVEEHKNFLDRVQIDYVTVEQGNLAALESSINSQAEVLFTMGNHVFDPKVVRNLIDFRLQEGDLAVDLVETGVKDLSGIPTTASQLKLSPDSAQVVQVGVGHFLDQFDALDAGILKSTGHALREALTTFKERLPYFPFAQVLDALVEGGTVRSCPVGDCQWFAVEAPVALNRVLSSSWIQEVAGPSPVPAAREPQTTAGEVARRVVRGKPGVSRASPHGGNWGEFQVENWRSAVFREQSFFHELYKDTTKFVKQVVAEFSQGRPTSVVEVGSGTGEFLWPLLQTADRLVGVDINPAFVEWCRGNVAEADKDRVHFVTGNATNLSKLVTPLLDREQGDFRVVACVGNTMGIIPAELHERIYKEMAKLAGPDGIVLVVYWNAKHFGEAIQKFYAPNPNLCGSLEGAVIDWEGTTMSTKSGYRTHWTGLAEAEQNFLNIGMRVHITEEHGKGVMVVASQHPGPSSSSSSEQSSDSGCSFQADLLSVEEKTSQQYYDSDDAFNFYKHVWGGDNIHVGIYPDDIRAVPVEPSTIKAASQLALETLSAKIPIQLLTPGRRLMDMGSAYGGASRYFAGKFGVRVLGVDLSTKECETNVQTNKRLEMEDLVEVKCASFTDTHQDAATFDVVISEDSFLHAGKFRAATVQEAARVLKPGGYFVFSDIMQADEVDREKLQPIYERIHLHDMASPSFYKREAELSGLEFVEFDDQSKQLGHHYSTVKRVLLAKKESFIQDLNVSRKYIENMCDGLQHWVDGEANGLIKYGFFVFKKV